MTACKICGNTDSVLWHRFIHEPKICFCPEGIRYSGEVFCLCDSCMAEMIDTALDIRKGEEIIRMDEYLRMNDYVKTRMDVLDRDVSDAARNTELPRHSVRKPKEGTGDETASEDEGAGM